MFKCPLCPRDCKDLEEFFIHLNRHDIDEYKRKEDVIRHKLTK